MVLEPACRRDCHLHVFNDTLSLTSSAARSIYLEQGHAKIEISVRLWSYQSTEPAHIIIITMLVIKQPQY